MGINIYSCSCFKKKTDLAIELDMSSFKRGHIKIFAKPQKMQLNNSISMGTFLSKISNNNENDSLIIEIFLSSIIEFSKFHSSKKLYISVLEEKAKKIIDKDAIKACRSYYKIGV